MKLAEKEAARKAEKDEDPYYVKFMKDAGDMRQQQEQDDERGRVDELSGMKEANQSMARAIGGLPSPDQTYIEAKEPTYNWGGRDAFAGFSSTFSISAILAVWR